MKTDKLLKLIQQKKAMRSGGALPLPKHQGDNSQVGETLPVDPFTGLPIKTLRSVTVEGERPDTYANYMTNKYKDASLAGAMFVMPFDFILGFPQAALTKAFTGKYQLPSEAMGIENPIGAVATDVLLDPTNLVGLGALTKEQALARLAASKESGLLSNVYKINPWRFKPNPEAGYRMLGEEGYKDAVESGLIRPRQYVPRINPITGELEKINMQIHDHAHFNIGEPLDLRQTEMIGYEGPYMAEMKHGTWQKMTDAFPNDPEMQKSLIELGKDKDVWQHPLFGHIKVDDPRLKLYKQDWLRGYKEVPKSKTSYSIVRNPEGKVQFLDNETYRNAIVTGKQNIIDYLSDPRYQAVVERNQQIANRVGLNKNLPIQREMNQPSLYEARLTKIKEPLDLNDPRSLELDIINNNSNVGAQYTRTLGGKGSITVPRVYAPEKITGSTEHEILHHIYPNLGEGYPSFTPLETAKAKSVFKPSAELRKIEEANNVPLWYLDDVDELVPNSFDLARGMGIKKFEKYPGIDAFKKMLESYSGSKSFVKDALKLDTPRDYKRAWDMLSGVRLGVVPAAIGVGALQQSNQKKNGGLAKAQVGKPQPIVTLQRDQPITRMVKDPIIGFANDPNVVKYNQTLKDPVWSDPYQFLMNWYSDPVTKERLRKQGAPLNPMVEALNQKRFDDVFDWYLDQQEKNDKLAKSIYSKGDNFNDYVSFKEILNKISEHNYKRHADETNGFHIPSDSSVTITDNRRDKKLNNQTAVHELTHATPLDNFYRNYFENFKPTKADQKELDYFKENLEEIYPRIMDLRFQMNRDGILAPGIKVTPDMIEPYYNNSNDDIRNYYTPKELAKIMNEVAYNASAQESNLARHGGLTKFQSAGSVDFRLGPTVTKANALAKQNLHPVLPKTAVQYINFQDNRVMDPVIKGKKIEPTRRNNIDNVERDKINKIIKQAKLVGVDPATLLTNIIWETRAGETDDNWGHNLYEQTPTIEGLDSDSEKANIAAQGLLRQLNLGKKLYPQGPSYKQLQAYQGYGPLYPDTEKNYYKHENQAFYGIPVTKEKPLLTNKLFPYGKTIEQYRDSVVKPTLDKYSINYQKGGGIKDMVVSDLWKQITGSDWSQAKKLGLTDGSYDQNIALRDRLLKSLKNPAAEKPQLSNSPKAKLTFEPTTQMVAANPMVRDALVIKPSTQQLDYNFFKNQPFGVTDVYSIYPMDRQYEAMKGAYRQDQVYQTPTGIRAYIQNKLNNIKNLTNNDLVNSKIAAITYPVQAGVNIANTIAGDTPIRSDDDVMNLAMDVAAVVPMVKAIKNIAKPFKNINTQTPYRYKWNPEPGIEIIKKGKSSFFKDTPETITVTDKTARSKVKGYKPLSSLSVKKAKDESYSFDFNLKDAPGSSPKLFKILQSEVRKIQSRNNVWGKNNPMKFYENNTMSLDSYRLLRNRARDPNFNMKPKGTTFLNADASKTRFLDDLADPYISSAEDLNKLTPKKIQNIMNWYADGALMQFSTKKKALEAAKRFNDYFYPGITNIERLAVPRKFDPNTRKWNLEIPNFEFTMKKYGGSTRKIKIIKPK